MADVRWTPRARTSLDRIRRYYEGESLRFARALAEGILTATRRLETFPRSGRVVPEIGDEAIREVLYRGYRIVYVVTADDEEVDVLTVFHSSRPLDSLSGR